MKVSGSVQLKQPGRCTVLPRCSICDQVPEGGIRDGIRLYKAFICTRCERQIAYCDIESVQYQHLVDRIKRIFVQ